MPHPVFKPDPVANGIASATNEYAEVPVRIQAGFWRSQFFVSWHGGQEQDLVANGIACASPESAQGDEWKVQLRIKARYYNTGSSAFLFPLAVQNLSDNLPEHSDRGRIHTSGIRPSGEQYYFHNK
jgi:hypothetical protein